MKAAEKHKAVVESLPRSFRDIRNGAVVEVRVYAMAESWPYGQLQSEGPDDIVDIVVDGVTVTRAKRRNIAAALRARKS